MKKIIALLAVVTGLGFIAPAESTARDYRFGDRRIVERHSCGEPIYATYQVTKRDRNGRIVERGWVREPHRCRYDRDRDHRHDHDHDHGRGPDRPRRGFFFFGR